ncbi:hypothetical protein [Sphingobacterium mizutaii]|uniref:hypothetical protein n=1 Tax=Sphingobacterium mizutaii TaxID=1010 RepID=UPI003D99EDA1
MTINSVQRIIEVEMTNNSILKEQSRDDAGGSPTPRINSPSTPLGDHAHKG